MMPPGNEPISTTGRVVPYPGYCLTLGPNLWLDQAGALITGRGPSRRCDITPETLEYWEECALAGQGKTLSELIV